MYIYLYTNIHICKYTIYTQHAHAHTHTHMIQAVTGKLGIFGLRASAGIAITTGMFTGAGSLSAAHSYLLPMLKATETTNQPKRLSAQSLVHTHIRG
jgi:hypothetical protein